MKIVLRVLIVLSLGLAAGCGDDESNAVIRGMSPNQVSLGQINAVGSITGSDLNATAVSLGDGITVTNFAVKSSTEIEVTFNVSSTAAPGPRTISLTTSGGAITGTGLLNVTSNKVPKAAFRISPSAGSVQTTFTFDASDSVDQRLANAAALSFNWEFGDGATASGKTVKHKYNDLGEKNVVLRVTDEDGGFAVAQKSVEILKNSPPVPVMKITPGGKGDTNTFFTLDGRGSKDPDGRITDYIWDTGDGKRKKRGDVVEHQYEKQGDYTISLTVVDNKGQLASDTRDVEVEKATEIVCSGRGGRHPTFLRGEVVSVEPGNWAIVDFGAGANCNSHWNRCDDFRRWGVHGLKEFFGIVDAMKDRGNGLLAVKNICPLNWPPVKGEEVFLIYKTCNQNSCP
jgi:PKD repeat protein